MPIEETFLAAMSTPKFSHVVLADSIRMSTWMLLAVVKPISLLSPIVMPAQIGCLLLAQKKMCVVESCPYGSPPWGTCNAYPNVVQTKLAASPYWTHGEEAVGDHAGDLLQISFDEY